MISKFVANNLISYITKKINLNLSSFYFYNYYKLVIIYYLLEGKESIVSYKAAL
jgi:hypothetical protein